MSKPCYSDYIRHILRFYIRKNQKTEFLKESDKLNWIACESVLNQQPEGVKEILHEIYTSQETFPMAVRIVSIKRKIPENIVWDFMKTIEKRIAEKRGLI